MSAGEGGDDSDITVRVGKVAGAKAVVNDLP